MPGHFEALGECTQLFKIQAISIKEHIISSY